ncbi:MAG: Spy/CpxP family protein refolding chaperone [Pseudomonadota bacterium]
MKAILMTFIPLLLTLTSPTIQAETETSAAQLEERLAQARARLELTDRQAEQMQPVMQESLARQRSILASYGLDLDNPDAPSERPGFRQARAMRGELEDVRADMLTKLEDILTPSQLDEFKQMQEAQRAEIRERIRARMAGN